MDDGGRAPAVIVLTVRSPQLQCSRVSAGLEIDGGQLSGGTETHLLEPKALWAAYSAVVVWLGASVVLALMPKANPAGSRSAITAAEVLRGMVDGVLAAVALPGLLLVVLMIVAAVIHAKDVKRRDPVRRFSRQQRREGMARAGGQCEMESGPRRRCPLPAEHGDHFYPWSKGGSTSLENFVAACARCNRAKGARVPSPGQQARMERRRREYVAPAGSVSVGARQPLS